MPTLHEIERATETDHASADYWAQARSQLLLDWLTDHDPDRVLDLGCGSGYLTAAIAEAGVDTVGVDINADSVAVARGRVADTDAPAEFRVGDATALDEPADSADAVVLADLIEHFDDPGPLLREARRVCRPDGVVLTSTPAYRWLWGPHDERNGHADRYTRKRLRWTAERHGLTVRRTRYTNTLPLLPYLLTQRVLGRDVPAAARGEHGPVLDTVKSAALAAERRVEWPVGVTLLAELAPVQSATDVDTVLLMNYEYPPGCGGGGVFTHDLRERLQARGYTAPLVTADAASADSENAVPDLLRFPFASLPDLRRTIREHDPDIINSHFALPTSLLLPLVSRWYDIPYVVSVMGADVHDPTRYHRLRPLMRRCNRWGVFRHAARVVAPSRDMRDRLPGDAPAKADVIPFFVDADQFTPPRTDKRPHDPIRLLSVCRLVPRKNLQRTLRAVAQVREEHDIPVEYSIVGGGSQRETLETTAADLGIGDAVEFHGHQPRHALPDIYREHDIFVLPSHHEGFGIVYLEALASGCPVVAADVGGQTDIVTDGVGVTVSPHDATAISIGIGHVCRQFGDLAPNCRDRVTERFTARAVATEYERVFAEVCSDA